jgi:hypothetical protein
MVYFILQGLSLVLVQRKEKTMLVAFGGKGSELSNQVLPFFSLLTTNSSLNTAAGIFSASNQRSRETKVSHTRGLLNRSKFLCALLATNDVFHSFHFN